MLKPKQLKAIELMANPDTALNRTKIMEEVGIGRTAFYAWLKDAEFLEALNKKVEQYTDSEIAVVWKSLIRQIEKGDTSAIKLYFELKGKYKQQVELQSVDINITIDGDEI